MQLYAAGSIFTGIVIAQSVMITRRTQRSLFAPQTCNGDLAHLSAIVQCFSLSHAMRLLLRSGK